MAQQRPTWMWPGFVSYRPSPLAKSLTLLAPPQNYRTVLKIELRVIRSQYLNSGFRVRMTQVLVRTLPLSGMILGKLTFLSVSHGYTTYLKWLHWGLEIAEIIHRVSRTVAELCWVYHQGRTSIVFNIQWAWQINILKHPMRGRKRRDTYGSFTRATDLKSRVTDEREEGCMFMNYSHLWNGSGIYHFSVKEESYTGEDRQVAKQPRTQENTLFVIWQMSMGKSNNRK